MSAAYPDIKLNYSSISPQLSENINEYLQLFTKLHKLLLEVIEKVGNIHSVASGELLSVVDFINKRISEVTKNKTNSASESIVKFINKFAEQIEYQAKTLQNLKASFSDCVVKPLQESVDKKKKVWETCFHYADSFVRQINNKEEDLQKRHKDYSEAAAKVKPGNRKDKALQIFHDSHNTYLLRLSSVNSINNLLYTHVLPHTVNSIDLNHAELNDQVRHHVKYLFSTQKDSMKKMLKSVDKLDHATDKIDVVADFRKFVKVSSKNITDRSPPVFKFTLPKVEPGKMVVVDNIVSTFVINRRTQPNLQRRLAALQQQTEQLVDSIASMREEGSEEFVNQNTDPSINELREYLGICDKEANLNVLLKQMELYTPTVVDFLGPMPDNLLSERKNKNKVITDVPVSKDGLLPHQFVEPRLMKPISCFYCGKLIVFIGKGYTCKVCKLSVHKKCATNVQFCQPIPINTKSSSTPDVHNKHPVHNNQQPIESSSVYDLIDLESDSDYYDDDEFDDGLSDEDEIYGNLPAHGSAALSPVVQSYPAAAPVQSYRPSSIQAYQQPAYQPSSIQPYDTKRGILQPEKPAVSPKPNLVLNSPVVKVLPDLLANTNNGSQQSSSKTPKLRATQSFSTGSGTSGRPLQNQKSFDLHRMSLTEEIMMKPPPLIERNDLPKSTKPTTISKPSLISKPNVSSKPSVTYNKSSSHSKPSSHNKPNSHKGDKPSIKTAKPSVGKPPVSKKPPILKKKPVLSNINQKPALPQVPQQKEEAMEESCCISLYDYRGDQETDLSFVSGCKIELREKTDKDWWYGASNGYEGYFPSQYVLEIDPDDCVMRALYTFAKESETELDVDEGDILVFISEEDDWIKVRSKNGEGLVPASYVEQVGNQSLC